jgi:hypothetical protein
MQIAASQPDFVPPHRYLADSIYFPEGNYPAYFTEKGIVARLRHDATAGKTIEAEQKAYARGGQRGLFEQRLAAARDSFDHGNGSAFELANAYAALGQNDETMKYLEIAYQRHDLLLTTLITNREFQPLHQMQNFRELVAKVGLPPVQ